VSTPLRAQYLRLKQQFPNALVLFRLGDFYELYDADACVAVRELGLTLTAREFAGSERVPLCPLPSHAAEGHIKRLVARGYKVAITEQVGDPRMTTGLVVREVVRVVSPSSTMHSPVTPTFRDGTKGAPMTVSIAPADASAVGAPLRSSPHTTERGATAITQLALFDIAAHDGNQGR